MLQSEGSSQSPESPDVQRRQAHFEQAAQVKLHRLRLAFELKPATLQVSQQKNEQQGDRQQGEDEGDLPVQCGIGLSEPRAHLLHDLLSARHFLGEYTNPHHVTAF